MNKLIRLYEWLKIKMKIFLKKDLNPDPEFYYRSQFKIYFAPYLIWDRKTWKEVLIACHVYRIEADGKDVGDIIFQGDKGTKYIVDLGIFPQYQRKGIGKAVLKKAKKMGKKLTAVTRKETLEFFLKSGFLVKRTIKNYYAHSVDGYYITLEEKEIG